MSVLSNRELDDQKRSSEIHIQKCELGLIACAVKVPSYDRDLSIQLFPFPVRALEPVYLKVRNSHPDITIVKSWFEGVDMDMGRHFFIPDKKSSDENLQAFKGMIPVCTLDENMDWKLMLEMKVDSVLYTFQFNLQKALN